MERRYIESRLWTCLTSEFLEQVRSRYHFEEKDKALLKGVASDLAGCLKWKEAAYLMFADNTDIADTADTVDTADTADTVRRATAVVTLGSDVDLLQERYQNTGRMLESYMLESIGGELLMLGYGMLEAWIRENTGYQVMAYHFYGDDEAHPLSAMPEILARAKQHKVVCTAGYCLKPKKSVVFEMELALAEACGGTAHSGRICAHCSRRDTCPNRR